MELSKKIRKGKLTDSLDVQHMAGGQAIAKSLEVVEFPDHFLVAGDFKKLGVVRAGMAISDNDIAVWKGVQSGNPC